MAIALKKGVQKPAGSVAGSSEQAAKPSQAPQAAQAKGGLTFLKKGKAAQETFAKEEHKAEVAAKGNVFRFFVTKDKEASITFLDGDIVDGVLDTTFYYEHNLNMNGKWGNFFACTQEEEPCPICEGGNNPSYVCVLTVIDHSSYVSKKDGQTKKDNIKLFVAKRETYKMLQKLAIKRGGLRGCRFDVSRTGDKSPSVGNVFDFTEKLTDAQLVEKYGADKSKAVNYEEYFGNLYMPAKELRKLGFGSTAGPIGSEQAPEDGSYDDVPL